MLPKTDDLARRVTELFAHWRVPAGPVVRVQWNDRLSSTAGRAFCTENRIELNPAILAHRPSDLAVVLVHEAAHLAAHRLFGPRTPAHGRHWRGLMRLAGLPPDVTHDLPVPRRARRSRRRYVYLRVCDPCGDRRIAAVVNYSACDCGNDERFLVLRAPASEDGLEALRSMSLEDVRRRCARGRRG